jgi:hypothetical protein
LFREVTMKRIALVTILLQIPVLALLAAEPAKECSLCVGVVESVQAPAAVLPDLERASVDQLPQLAGRVDQFTPDQRRQTTIIFTYSVDPSHDQLLQVEEATKTIVDWAKTHGPFDALAVDVARLEPATAAYAIKRLSVAAQGLSASARFAFVPPSLDVLPSFYDNGAGSYFDVVLVDAGDVPNALKWFAEHDPVKKIWARVPAKSPNALYDLARSLADGATRAFLTTDRDTATLAALAAFNNAMVGDYAYDATAKNEVLDAKGNKTPIASLTFVRGEDLRSIVVEAGDTAASTIVSLDSDRYDNPRLVDAAGIRTATDVGRKGGRFLIGLPPTRQPVAIAVDRAEKPNANITKEAIEITTKRGITVEEIIRNHQAYKAYQESIQPRYIALDTTKLRFVVAEASDTIEATIAGDYFSDPQGRADWVWRDFYINGVRWKYGRIPELPLIQPEKVSQLPLDIHLTNEYRYQLVRETDLSGYHTYEVRFEPPPNAPAGLPLYRGTVWIDTHTWARIRIAMIQLNLTGEVLSNEERVDFQPFARTTHAPLAPATVAATDPHEIIWLPLEVNAQQVISAAGRANPVLRATSFTDFRIEPAGFETSLAEAEKSDYRMLRETKAGLRYLEKTKTGERVVKEGFDTARTFLLGGIHHDKGLDYPVVPLGGIDYFNFDLFNRGIQTNVFFAGVIVAANATNPNVANTRTNLGADFFGIAIPFTNSFFRNGVEQKDEAVKALPLRLSVRAGHPFLQFGKVDVSFTVEHDTYMRSDTTAPSFIVPADTFVLTPSLTSSYSRWGWVFSGYYDYNRRSTWKPWGDLTEYNPNQKSYVDYGASIGKAFYLPKFQRLSIDVNYIDGQRLDRFSKYELGFFGAQRVHGVESGSVRAEKATLAHLSYGFVFSDQFRLETFYDHAFVDDTSAGYHNEPFQGVGLGGQTVGPWGTILRLDLGKTVGRNKQSGFVANVVFLKLF